MAQDIFDLFLALDFLENYLKIILKEISMKKRGRPFNSEIRQRIIEILAVIKRGYGYEIYKIYSKVFPKATMRSIYYHLRKGIDLGEIEVDEKVSEKGDFSWGSEAEKTYYKLGPNAKPKGNESLSKFLKKE